MSTRRTYEMLSKALKDARAQTPGSPHSPAFVAGVDTSAEYVAGALETLNPHSFDRERFLRDAGVTP